jgi:hypothetical protein
MAPDLMAIILRLYSYLFHFVLALFLLGISAIALTSHSSLSLGMFPWTGETLTRYLFYGSLLGLVSLLLAITGIFRYLFPVWALVVLVLMMRGFLLMPYQFSGKDEFNRVLFLIAGALLAFLGSLTLFSARKRKPF